MSLSTSLSQYTYIINGIKDGVEKVNHRPIILFVRRPILAIVAVVAVLLIFGGSVRLVMTMAHGIRNKVIVIDAGHGGKDPGAQYGRVKEKDINLDIALRLYHTLSSKGYKVILTRSKAGQGWPSIPVAKDGWK